MCCLEGAVTATVSPQSRFGSACCSWHASAFLGVCHCCLWRHAKTAGLSRMAILQGLDLAPYLSEAGSLENTGPCTYDLAGVCAHDGKSVNCGHYRAVCRRGLDGKLSGVLRVALYGSQQTDMSDMQGSSIISHRGIDKLTNAA